MTQLTLWNWQTWSCMNLWATEVRDLVNDSASFHPKNCQGALMNCNSSLKWIWDYYQWWRNNTWFTNGYWTYTDWQAENNNAWWWWSTTLTSWTWADQTLVNKSLMQWPCPDWWHIPTIYEWKLAINEITKSSFVYWSSDVSLRNTLRLPASAYRYPANWSYDEQFKQWTYWSSTPDWHYASLLNIRFYDDTLLPWNNQVRATWDSIRCLKN
jgi:hypothetical protein